jgi:hypothetical protein
MTIYITMHQAYNHAYIVKKQAHKFINLLQLLI